MPFQINVTLSESDYLFFNIFHSLESTQGKKQSRNGRITFLCFSILLIALVVIILGWTPFSVTYLILLGLFVAVYLLLFKKIVKHNLSSQIKKLKKAGKLPFDAIAQLTFHEDRIEERTDATHTEQNYSVLERVCIIKNRYIYLYTSSVQAYILPIPQLCVQCDQDAFIRFLSAKCNTIEYYQL